MAHTSFHAILLSYYIKHMLILVQYIFYVSIFHWDVLPIFFTVLIISDSLNSQSRNQAWDLGGRVPPAGSVGAGPCQKDNVFAFTALAP